MADCILHPNAPHGEPCSRCGDFTCPHCAPEYAGARFCGQRCVEETVLEREPAWESGIHRFGSWRAWWITVAAVVRDPAAFYGRTPIGANSDGPIAFCLFAITIVGSPAILVQGLGFSALTTALSGSRATSALVSALVLVPSGIASGLVGLGVLIASTGALIAIARPKHGLRGTARVLAYAWGTAVALALLPGLGPLIAAVVVPRAVYHGLRVVQGVGAGTALAGALVSAAPFAIGAAALADVLPRG